MHTPDSRRGPRTLAALALVIGTATLVTQAHATLPGKAGASVQIAVPSSSGFIGSGSDSAIPVTIDSGIVHSATGGSSAHAAVTASFGKIATSATGSAVGTETNVFAAAGGYYQDGWSFLYDGHTGEAITVTQAFSVSGTLVNPRTSLDTPGSAWGLLISDDVGRYLANVDSTTSDANLAYKEGVAVMNASRTDGTLYWTHTFRVGDPFSFKVSLGSGVNTQFAKDFTASVDFSHTVELTSITVFHGGLEVPSTDYTLVTSSGFQYLPAVPEPSTWAMLALGLGFTGVMARRGNATC